MITLPWPSRDLSSNARVHWSRKARATKAARTEAWAATRVAKLTAPDDGPIPLTVTFYPPHRRGDPANWPALVKAHLDGLADGLGCNDRRFQPRFIYADAEPPGRVEIALEVA
jgi:crossover junction endodeoxyribonuclease RusA